MRRMRIGHYYPTLFTAPSGVTAAIKAWGATQTARGHEVVFLSEARSVPGNINVRHLGRHRITRIPLFTGRTLRELDLLVLHEGWTPSHYAAAAAARRAGTPYIVMAHGVYEPQIIARLKPPVAFRRALERSML